MKGSFSKAIAMYADLYVSEKDIKGFKEFCEYYLLEERLQEEKAIPELIYQKKDGKRLKLKVFKFKKYSDVAKETLWVFEEARI